MNSGGGFYNIFLLIFLRQPAILGAVANERRCNHIKSESHKSLGQYLARNYLQIAPRRYIAAFQFGCTQPDRNPITYLKGSLRSQWLRGHNWNNACRYMARLSCRLERKRKLRLLDYYAMGKLIHYTVDAFTSAHNAHFPAQLQQHREYEAQLQTYFLEYLKQPKLTQHRSNGTVMDTIRAHHEEYIGKPSDICTDSRYCVLVTSLIVCMLLL